MTIEPVISKLEKFILYETQSYMYLVGCDKRQSEYRMLKLDRCVRLPSFPSPLPALRGRVSCPRLSAPARRVPAADPRACAASPCVCEAGKLTGDGLYAGGWAGQAPVPLGRTVGELTEGDLEMFASRPSEPQPELRELPGSSQNGEAGAESHPRMPRSDASSYAAIRGCSTTPHHIGSSSKR